MADDGLQADACLQRMRGVSGAAGGHDKHRVAQERRRGGRIELG